MNRLIFICMFIFLITSCEKESEKESENASVKSKVKLIRNELGTSSIKLYYNENNLTCIVLKNTDGNRVVTQPLSPSLIDSIEFFYNDSKIEYGLSHKMRANQLPWIGSGNDSISINKIYFEINSEQRIVAMVDSLSRNIRTEYRFDLTGKYVGLVGDLEDTLKYEGENVSEIINTNGWTKLMDYDKSYNPYNLVNEALKFPFFSLGSQLSENNATKIITYSLSGGETTRKIPVSYDSKNRIKSYDIDIYIEYYD